MANRALALGSWREAAWGGGATPTPTEMGPGASAQRARTSHDTGRDGLSQRREGGDARRKKRRQRERREKAGLTTSRDNDKVSPPRPRPAGRDGVCRSVHALPPGVVGLERELALWVREPEPRLDEAVIRREEEVDVDRVVAGDEQRVVEVPWAERRAKKISHRHEGRAAGLGWSPDKTGKGGGGGGGREGSVFGVARRHAADTHR